MARYVISGLFYYPVKSLQGISARTVTVHPMGIAFDRRWMLVNDQGRFLTQREHPELATFSVAHGDGALHVTTAGGDTLRIDIQENGTRRVPVTVWDSRLDACLISSDCDKFFSDAIGRSVRLVRIPEAPVRPVDPQYGTMSDHVSFADGYPVLMTCTASLDDLNARSSGHIPMERFRPNIILSSDVPYEEDAWTRASTASVSLRLVKRCSRCVITTTDQRTGVRSAEPLETLATYRKEGNDVYFGMNCIPDGNGVLNVGDLVSAAS